MARKNKEKELPVVKSNNGILEKPIGKITEDAYLDFSSYINCHRHLPSVSDGMKVSYRRLIYSAMQFPKNKLAPSTTLINYVANTHPHGLQSMNDMAAVLVKSGVFSGEGAFGFTEIDGVINPPANERYTHIGLSDLYWEIIGDLVKEVPYSESPVGMLEPNYLPLPLPLGLFMKSLSSGMGVGIRMILPNFSPKSLYKAYIHNNPQLLEPNVDLIIDKKNSELERLWKTGKGRVIYSYKISRQTSHDGKTEGILFETKDGCEIFTPKLSKFEKLENDGKIFIDNLTDINSNKLFIGRVPGAKGITVDDIENLARKCCYDATIYQINVTDGQQAFRIPLYDWIDYTYKNYIQLVSEVNQKKIEKCKFDILVLEALPYVSDYILNKNPKATDNEISKALNIPVEVVEVVMSKPISYLRKNKDTTERVKGLKDKLKELKKFNPVTYTEEIINKL